MAKYCMFCGNQLPDIAQFCAKCGQKQPDPEPEEYEEKIEDTEDASDEMDLLSQFGFVSTPKPQKKKTPNIIIVHLQFCPIHKLEKS